jgi:hypothetical protein
LNRVLLLFFIGMCLSCGQIKTDKAAANKYFDVNGLIDYQVVLLDSISPLFLKRAVIDGKEENTQFSANDSSAWAKELAIFKSADINKPMLVDSYTKIESEISGIKTIIYQSKYPDATQVDSLAISFASGVDNPSKIHAHIADKNALFQSAKNIELTFENVKDQNMLSGFKIEGWQKMVAQDRSSYKIEGTLKY